ncbi:hypothetical protein PsYK624_139400 [Phanerochaete sordida]|uniref:Uncharacterized protein n=1 Tax=Phanerochaete sordida TaxID=48140 RepID=A0A9P3LKI2_9APHY|nr:hypothetical protein PsYK624_139400 [Phanerochaete sordida]
MASSADARATSRGAGPDVATPSTGSSGALRPNPKGTPVDPAAAPGSMPFHDVCEYATARLAAGQYVELWYFTRAGVDYARAQTSATSGLPSARALRDEALRWDDVFFASGLLRARMLLAGWEPAAARMLAEMYRTLNCEHAHVGNEALLVRYAADVRREWHAAVGTPRAFNPAIINEQRMLHIATFHMLDAPLAQEQEDFTDAVAPLSGSGSQNSRERKRRRSDNRY